jgi:hypothetical protein
MSDPAITLRIYHMLSGPWQGINGGWPHIDLRSACEASFDFRATGPQDFKEAFAGLRKNITNIGKVEIISNGWWLGEGAAPSAARIIDHVACHLPSPLTGSQEAATGKAFVSMKNAYEIVSAISGLNCTAMPQAVLWHTSEVATMTDEEVSMAREAGCQVAGPYVAPWAVLARSAGLKVSAMVLVGALVTKPKV